MRKRRRRGQRKPAKQRGPSVTALKRDGLKAFNNGDYRQAIQLWSQTPDYAKAQRFQVAIAEAYFRLGLQGTVFAVDNFRAAINLQPDEARYWYHLGLAYQREGNLEEALAAYAKAVGEPEWRARAAYPYALAWQQSGQELANAPTWETLSAGEREMLTQTQVFGRRPYHVAANAAPLWQGLAALDRQEYSEAEPALQEATAVPGEAGISHYYLGVLAAEAEAWQKAVSHWSAALQAGFDTSRLQANLGELYHRLAEDRLQNQVDQGAMTAATEALRHKPDDKNLQQLLSHLYQKRGHEAAQQGEWQTALDAWNQAREKGGGSFRIAYNLALAYEKLEAYLEAAEQWREALRRRPRKADHPDAMSDKQVGRLWQRTAQAYIKAEEFDEAVHVYKLAVKWQPDDLALRLALANGLLDNGQLQAALNETERILERDPKYVPALIKAGEILAQNDYWWYHSGAVRYWEQALAFEPDNETAKQHLVDFYMDRAEHHSHWDDIDGAFDDYEQILKYQPNNGIALAELAHICYAFEDEEEAESYSERAQQAEPGNMEMYARLIVLRFMMEQSAKAAELVALAAANISNLSPFFYLDIATEAIVYAHNDLAEQWLARVIEIAPADMPALVLIGEHLTNHSDERVIEVGRDYLQRALKDGQYPGQVHLALGVLAAKEDDMKTADKEWRQAKKLARRAKDEELLERIEFAEAVFTSPLGLLSALMSRSLGESLEGMPPPAELLNMLGDMFGNDFDEDDDDEFYF